MASSIQSDAPRPVGSNGVSERLLDPLRLEPREVQARGEDAKADARRGDGIEAFADYLNQAGITVLEKTAPATAFDPAAEIEALAVYGSPTTKPLG